MTPRLPGPGALLPHGPGMMLLDELLQADAERVECRVRIHPRSQFFEHGRGVPNWVGIEYMAQAIGVHAGYLRRQRGLPIEVGLLLGTRSLELSRAWFPDGAALTVRASLLLRDAEGVGAYSCSLEHDDEIWAQALIKAFQPDHIRGFLDSIYGGRA